MPCFNREKTLPTCQRRGKTSDRGAPAPKPVHPRPLRLHGLFGLSFVREHQFTDDRWTPGSLNEQFKGMGKLIARHSVFKWHETHVDRSSLAKQSKQLKQQCRDGHTRLQNLVTGDNTKKISNLLSNYKDMQRLYKRMPIHQVVDNINQRTFTMRKERDRLSSRLDLLKAKYKKMLVFRATVENRIKYQNEFVLEEELKARELMKEIENSEVRIKAIRTINVTYKKMIKVLEDDAIYYEPILRSLDADMVDQANFIKHILHLGMPAISKFTELSKRYEMLENKSQRMIKEKLEIVSSLTTKTSKRGPSSLAIQPTQEKKSSFARPSIMETRKRYVRETRSMAELKMMLKTIESTMKEVHYVTLSSQTSEIYSRLKGQIINNQKLQRMVECDVLAQKAFEEKMQYSDVLKSVLINNLSTKEIDRLEHIENLRKHIKSAEEFEQSTMDYIRYRGNLYLMLRSFIWSLAEILRHVDRSMKTYKITYPNSYLKLPLLKFEFYDIFASVPEYYETNLTTMMTIMVRKVYALMKGYSEAMTPAMMIRCRDEYHADFLATITDELGYNNAQEVSQESEHLQLENKHNISVPGRLQIKAWSTKCLENVAKRENE